MGSILGLFVCILVYNYYIIAATMWNVCYIYANAPYCSINQYCPFPLIVVWTFEDWISTNIYSWHYKYLNLYWKPFYLVYHYDYSSPYFKLYCIKSQIQVRVHIYTIVQSWIFFISDNLYLIYYLARSITR